MSMLFGNDNAENDDFLYDCVVQSPIERLNEPILTGRWGTGKTATFLIQHHELSSELERVNAKHETLWYRNENSIPLTSLAQIIATQSDSRILLKAFENMWLSEILAIHCRLLEILRERFQSVNTTKPHWQAVKKAATVAQSSTVSFLWDNAATFVGLVSGSADRERTGTNIKESLATLIDEQLYEHVKDCLDDVRTLKPRIAVVVEPIDTPHSDLESKYESIADLLIAALVNVWQERFQPSRKNPFQVRLGIPWHRTKRKKDLWYQPQKVEQFMKSTYWRRDDLRQFACRRIEREYRSIGRHEHFRPSRDAWDTLFPRSIMHRRYDAHIEESTFDYIIRHTHHRPRDLQALLRSIVRFQANIANLSDTEFLRRGDPIRVDTIRDCMRRQGRARSDLLLIEAERRFPGIDSIARLLAGIRVPFSMSEFLKRLSSAQRDDTPTDSSRILAQLWESGIVGITAYTKSRSVCDELEQQFVRIGKRDYSISSGEIRTRWTWFEYNHLDADPGDLLLRIDRIRSKRNADGLLADIDFGITLHPILFEVFQCHLPWDQCPIGS